MESLRNALSMEEITYGYVPKPVILTMGEEEHIQAALSRISRKKQRIKEAYENGIDTLEEYHAGKTRLEKEQEELRNRLMDLNRCPARDKTADKLLLADRIRNVCDILSDPEVSYEMKGNALRSVVKKIVYDKQEGTMKFFYYISR